MAELPQELVEDWMVDAVKRCNRIEEMRELTLRVLELLKSQRQVMNTLIRQQTWGA